MPAFSIFDQPQGPLRPIWRFFGYDEANYTFSNDGREMLSRIAALNDQPVFVRSHHLLTSGQGETIGEPLNRSCLLATEFPAVRFWERLTTSAHTRLEIVRLRKILPQPFTRHLAFPPTLTGTIRLRDRIRFIMHLRLRVYHEIYFRFGSSSGWSFCFSRDC